jgi:hypothetical protein
MGAWKEISLNKVRYPYQGYVHKYCDLCQSMWGESDAFSNKIGLHQRSVLSPYIFTFVMDEITKDIQWDISLCMLFADDVVLIDKSGIEVDQKLELWR